MLLAISFVHIASDSVLSLRYVDILLFRDSNSTTKILMSNFEAIISLWQAITGCVAMTERLTYRHIDNDKSYPRCDGLVESINHFLF